MIGAYHGEVRMLAFLPLYHIFGLEAMYLWFAFVGSGFVFVTDMAPANLLRTVRNNNVTHIFAVPLLWHAVEKNVVHTIAGEDEKLQKKFETAKKISLACRIFHLSLASSLQGRHLNLSEDACLVTAFASVFPAEAL